jgi:hypothetical protein
MNKGDNEIIKLFVEKADRLRNHSLNTNNQLKVKRIETFTIGENVKTISNHIDEEAFESYLARLRFFCNQGEIIFFPKVIKILTKYENDEKYISLLREAKNYFLKPPKNYELRLEQENSEGILSVEVFSEKDMFNLYMNAKFFHLDQDKLNILSCMQNVLNYPFDMFRNYVVDINRLIIGTLKYINHRVLKNEENEVTVRKAE